MSVYSEKMPTLREKSTWTPRHHQQANEKIYQERIELIKKWYSVWSRDQQWELIDHILMHLSDSDLSFIHSLLDPLMPRPPPPEIREDFTRLLPRKISFKIFSYLDPRSLCRSAQVSWYWNYLCQQNQVWKFRCLQRGWFLPVPPASLADTCTVWKRHYIACVQQLHWIPPQPLTSDDMQFKLSSSPPPPSPPPQKSYSGENRRRKKKKSHTKMECNGRPPWKHSSIKPTDLTSKTLYTSSKQSPLTQKKPLESPQPISQSQSLPVSYKQTTKVSQQVITPSCSKNSSCQMKKAPPVTTTTPSSPPPPPSSSPPPPLSDTPVLHSSLLEKLRLGEDTNSNHPNLSAVNQSLNISQSQIEESLRRVQSNSPFPKLPPYYTIGSNSLPSHSNHDTDNRPSLGDEEKTNTGYTGDSLPKATTSIRNWTPADFPSSTDSD